MKKSYIMIIVAMMSFQSFSATNKVISQSEIDSCYKEAYYSIKEINTILDRKENEPNSSLFVKIKKSKMWNSLNKENKEIFAKMMIKWTLEGEEKLSETKAKIGNYYITNCKELSK